MRRKQSMTRTYLAGMLLLTIIPIVLIGYFWVSQRYQQFEQEAEKHREGFLSTHKQFLHDQVAEIIAYIEHERNLSEQRSKEQIRLRTERAYQQVEALFAARNPVTAQQRNALVQDIVTLLRPLRFSEGRGWYVLFSGDGRLLLNPAFAEGEQVAVLEQPEFREKPTLRQALATVKQIGAGYFEFSVRRPEDAAQYSQRLCYLKYFQPLDLVILTGDYRDDVEHQIQKHVLTVISETRFYPQRSEPFVADSQGTLLALPGAPEVVGTNISGFNDAATGRPVFALHRIAARQSAGEFVEFRQQMSAAAPFTDRVNFVRAYQPWGWLVGSGLSLDQLEARIAADREALRKQVALEIGFIVVGLLMTIVIVVGIASDLARRTASGFRLFAQFFNQARHRLQAIDKTELPYTEFVKLAEDANWMVEQRSRYERALQDNDRRFKLALRYSQHYLWDLDLKSGELSVSEGFFESLGYQPQDLDFSRFDTVLGLCHPDDVALLQSKSPVQRVYRSGIEFRLRDSNHCYRWLLGRGSRMQSSDDPDGRYRMLGIVTEISERKHIEQELVAARIAAEEASEAKIQFLSTMSHELKTPLNGVMGYAQLLKRETSLSPRQQEYLSVIIDCGDHLLELIGDLLKLARHGEGEEKISRDIVNIAVLVREVADAGAAMAQTRGIQLQVDIDSGVPATIVCETGKLRHILGSLVVHAIRVSERGSVRLRVENDSAGRELHFSVTDCGGGISAADLATIFEPFRQPQRTDGSGSGLELALSQRLAESMGWSLVASGDRGRGTTFTLKVPLQVASGAAGGNQIEHAISYQSQNFSIQDSLSLGAVSPARLQQLRQALEDGDVDALGKLVQAMLEQSTDPALSHWLLSLLDSLEHFDLDSVQQMIRQA